MADPVKVLVATLRPGQSVTLFNGVPDAAPPEEATDSPADCGTCCGAGEPSGNGQAKPPPGGANSAGVPNWPFSEAKALAAGLAGLCAPTTDPYTPRAADVQRVENDHTYHPAVEALNQPARYHEIRRRARMVGLRLVRLCPPSRELSLALTHLEQVVFYANAAIARHEQAPS